MGLATMGDGLHTLSVDIWPKILQRGGAATGKFHAVLSFTPADSVPVDPEASHVNTAKSGKPVPKHGLLPHTTTTI
jgi:hypothetical protein